ncbi:hypothetical protein [Streptomyces sp. AC512_CC834]|uniref:hypothetical protein n=1 Tax=Streptomyces sp. AC512_CC834 TaxID=2823691 RepID=UPI001C27BCB1|nr:hypothetical protein [Streptomyces sp. AC512_CC834]
MNEPIGRLATWVSLLLNPRGTHRRTRPRPATRTAPPPQSTTGVIPLPSHRSPYGLPTVLDGAETVAVRPYLLAGALYELEAAA